MSNVKSIFIKEFQSFLNSTMAYIFLVVFALVNGYFFTNTFFLIDQSDMRILFSTVPIVYLFFIPAVSMGLIAREQNQGTMETMLTLPIKPYEFILGKYLAALTLIVFGLLATFVHFFTLIKFGTNIDYGSIFSGYIGLILVAAVYTAIGIFASSLTDNQVVAFIIGVFLVLTLFLMDKVLIFLPSFLSPIIQYASVDFHLSNIARGVIDTRNLIYFFSMILFFLFATNVAVINRESK